MPKKKLPMARAVWQKFTINGDNISFHISNTYYDKDFYEQDGVVSVNEEMQQALAPSKKLLKLLKEGTIKNLKIQYDIT